MTILSINSQSELIAQVQFNAASTGDLVERDALEVKSTTHSRQLTALFTWRESLPIRRSSTSRPTTKRQLRAVGAAIMTTARHEELDLTGYTRVTNGLPGVASKRDTLVVSEATAGDDRASAACTCEEGNSDRQSRSGRNEESGSNEGEVELHDD